MPQHFVAPPQWEWYIIWYFFLGGLAGGLYLIGTLLRLTGDVRDEAVARLAFLVAFPAVVICPLLLTLDLGRPSRFWHMLIDSRTWVPNFKYWSPMSVGAWALLLFGIFVTLSFIEVLFKEGYARNGLARGIAGLMSSGVGRVLMIIGACLGLFIAGYTGVLISVSNQPVWSDTWTLGGVFLASGLSVAAGTLMLIARGRSDAVASTERKLSRADAYFIILELILLVAFFLTLGALASRMLAPRWLALWALVAVGTIIPLAMTRAGSGHRGAPVLAALLVLIGGLALRIVVIFSAQM